MFKAWTNTYISLKLITSCVNFENSSNLLLLLFRFTSYQDPLEFQAQELQKHFKMGDHVKVIGGRYEGDTGLIVRVEDNMVVLFADLTMHEVGMQLS